MNKDSSYSINAGINPDAKITVALKRRRGVCENFAAIFNDICLKTGIASFVINGYTRQSGSVDKAGIAGVQLSSIKNGIYSILPGMQVAE